MAKVFLIDINRCNGCRNCQIACKDEHCLQSWLPYSEAQPLTGQFWMNVKEQVRGKVPVVKLSYIPIMGAQNDAIKDYAPEALMEREDGLIVIDPAKAKGRKDIADKFEGVWWNEKLQIPQGCTGCAHLLDNGFDVPRCVDACMTDALFFVDESEVDKARAEKLAEGGNVYYYNLPKRFVAGRIFNSIEDEVVIGAEVTLIGSDGEVVASQKTDEFGDFKFDQVGAESYTVKIVAGEKELAFPADATQADVVFDDIDVA